MQFVAPVQLFEKYFVPAAEEEYITLRNEI